MNASIHHSTRPSHIYLLWWQRAVVQVRMWNAATGFPKWAYGTPCKHFSTEHNARLSSRIGLDPDPLKDTKCVIIVGLEIKTAKNITE